MTVRPHLHLSGGFRKAQDTATGVIDLVDILISFTL